LHGFCRIYSQEHNRYYYAFFHTETRNDDDTVVITKRLKELNNEYKCCANCTYNSSASSDPVKNIVIIALGVPHNNHHDYSMINFLRKEGYSSTVTTETNIQKIKLFEISKGCYSSAIGFMTHMLKHVWVSPNYYINSSDVDFYKSMNLPTEFYHDDIDPTLEDGIEQASTDENDSAGSLDEFIASDDDLTISNSESDSEYVESDSESEYDKSDCEYESIPSTDAIVGKKRKLYDEDGCHVSINEYRNLFASKS
jgi:hypothetical protein